MKNKNELLIPVFVLLLITAVRSWIFYKYTGDLLFFESLHDRGIETKAAVKNQWYNQARTAYKDENHIRIR